MGTRKHTAPTRSNPHPDATKAALRESDRFALLTLDALSAHIAVLDETGVIIAVNHAWRRFAEANFGTIAGVCEGANYLTVCDAARGDDAAQAAEFAAAVRAVIRGEPNEFSLEYPCHSPEEQRWFTVSISRFSRAGTTWIVVAHENITERKCAEQALRESENKFRAIADYTADWENWFGPDGKLLWVNRAVEQVTGYSVAECLAMPTFPLPLFAEEDRAGMSALFQETLKGTRGNDREFRILCKDGTKRWVSVSWQPIYSSDRTPLGHRSSLRDITERKQTEAELTRSREALRALTARMERVREEERTRIARQIHDELAPTFTDLKLDLAWLTRRLAEAGITGRSAICQRISAMTRRAEGDADAVRRIATELRPAVLDALGLAAAIEWKAREFEHKTRIHCEVETSGGLPALDSTQTTTLFRVFEEILRNVAQHAQATRVKVRLAEQSDRLVLAVRDNGRGITPAEQANPKALGLLGMRERAAVLDGEVSIKSTRGQGTIVTVSIPTQPA
jgi:PAS domain S-box-containing protein